MPMGGGRSARVTLTHFRAAVSALVQVPNCFSVKFFWCSFFCRTMRAMTHFSVSFLVRCMKPLSVASPPGTSQNDLDHRMRGQCSVQLIQLWAAGGCNRDRDAQVITPLAGSG